MALLTVQAITGTAAAPGFIGASSSDTVQPGGGSLWLHVKNASGTVDTVTVSDGGTTPAGSAAAATTFTVPITTGERLMVLSPNRADPVTGLITISHSTTASVAVAVFRI